MLTYPFVLVHSGHCKITFITLKLPIVKLVWVACKQQKYITVLEMGGLRLGRQKNWVLVKALFNFANLGKGDTS